MIRSTRHVLKKKKKINFCAALFKTVSRVYCIIDREPILSYSLKREGWQQLLMPKTAKNWPIRNSKQGFKWLLASAGYFIQGHGKVCRQPGVRYTYQLHMILRTPEVFRSVACRQPVSSSIRSGRCRRWSRTRARSHCYTDGNGQKAAALVTQVGWHSTHLGVSPPPPLPVLKPRENNREGDAAPPPHISSYRGRGREGAFLKKAKGRRA